MPSIAGQIPTTEERQLLSLPLHLSGLNIPLPDGHLSGHP